MSQLFEVKPSGQDWSCELVEVCELVEGANVVVSVCSSSHLEPLNPALHLQRPSIVFSSVPSNSHSPAKYF